MKNFVNVMLLLLFTTCAFGQEVNYGDYSFKANFFLGSNFQLKSRQTLAFVSEINALETKLGGLKIEFNKVVIKNKKSNLSLGLAYMVLSNNLKVGKSGTDNYFYRIQTNNFLTPITYRYMVNPEGKGIFFLEGSVAPNFSFKNTFTKKLNTKNPDGTFTEGENLEVKEANLRPFNTLISFGCGVFFKYPKYQKFGIEITPNYSFQTGSFLKNNISGNFKSIGLKIGIRY